MDHDETVYQFYTIVGEDEALVSTSVVEEHEDEVMYLSLRQDKVDDEVKEEVEVSSNVVLAKNEVVDDDDEDATAVANIEFVAFEDGQMYMTDETPGVDENFAAVDSEFVTDGGEDVLDVFEEQNLGIDTDICENDNDYRKIQLEDGTCAYIDKNLWNSLMENVDENAEKEEKVATTPTTTTAAAPEPKKKKPYECTFFGCNKTYSTAHHLTVHIRNHTGNRPYQCEMPGCEKAFATCYSLTAHRRTHTGEAPYSCVSCPKKFKTSGDLQKHVRTHTGEKPFKCPIEGCGRSFTTSNIRKVHVRSHTGERPYVCTHPNCGKAFASATNFKNHMRIHSGEKPYECNVPGCGRRFTEYSSLFKHNAVHMPFKPLKCRYCDQLCKHETTLRSHMQSMHKILIVNDGTEIHLTKDKSDAFIRTSAELTST